MSPSIALPSRKLWTPLDRRWDWLKQPVHAMGRAFSSSGWHFSASGGLFGSGSTSSCCLYQARLCSTGALAGIYVKKSSFPAFPATWYFTYSGTCYYVQSTDTAPCDATPVISGSGNYASCSACSGGGCTETTPSSLTVSGLSSILANCPTSQPDCRSNGFNGFCDATYYPEGDSMTIPNTGPGTWSVNISDPCTYYCVACSNPTGTAMYFSNLTISCTFSSGSESWEISMNAVYSGDNPVWRLPSGSGPTGTYPFAGDALTGNNSECGYNTSENYPYPIGSLVVS